MKRFHHFRAQFDTKHCIRYWSAFDHKITVPVALAVPLYPIMVGTRLAVWAGLASIYGLSNLSEWDRHQHRTEDPSDRFVLSLRTFGDDGGLLVGSQQVEGRRLLAKVSTVETVLVEAARTVGIENVSSFHDQEERHIPAGIRYIEESNRNWWKRFTELAEAASAIVVFSSPGVGIRPGFERELRHIAERENLRRKTILLSPPDLDPETLATANQIQEILDWPRTALPPLAAYLDSDGLLAHHPGIGSQDRYLRERYLSSLSTAISTVAIYGQ